MNPFADPEPNPWMPPQGNTRGPRYGNAYEDEPKHECDKTEYYSMDPYEDQKIAWDQPSSVADAYQYTGTRYGNAPDAFARGGDDYTTIDTSSPTPQSKSQIHDEPQPLPVTAHPSRKRLILRIIQLLAAVGHLGFAAGASPVSSKRLVCVDRKILITCLCLAVFQTPSTVFRQELLLLSFCGGQSRVVILTRANVNCCLVGNFVYTVVIIPYSFLLLPAVQPRKEAETTGADSDGHGDGGSMGRRHHCGNCKVPLFPRRLQSLVRLLQRQHLFRYALFCILYYGSSMGLCWTSSFETQENNATDTVIHFNPRIKSQRLLLVLNSMYYFAKTIRKQLYYFL